MKEKLVRFTYNLTQIQYTGFYVKNIGLGLGSGSGLITSDPDPTWSNKTFRIHNSIFNRFNRRSVTFFTHVYRLFNEGFYLHSRITIQIFSTEAPVVFFNLFGWGTSIERVRYRALRRLSSSSIYLAGVRP
jgi:hypothetical protein